MEKKRFIFDLDGTLLTNDFKDEKDYFHDLFGDDAKDEIANIGFYLNEYENIFSRYEKEQLTQFLASRTNLPLTKKIIEGWIEVGLYSHDELEKGVLDTLEYLKHDDHSLVVLTNWFYEGQIPRLKRAGIYDYFDDFITGDEVLKPHKDSYLRAKGDFNLDSCIVIGDSLERDYIGPRAVGMESILYDKDNRHHENIVKIKRMNELKKKY